MPNGRQRWRHKRTIRKPMSCLKRTKTRKLISEIKTRTARFRNNSQTWRSRPPTRHFSYDTRTPCSSRPSLLRKCSHNAAGTRDAHTHVQNASARAVCSSLSFRIFTSTLPSAQLFNFLQASKSRSRRSEVKY